MKHFIIFINGLGSSSHKSWGRLPDLLANGKEKGCTVTPLFYALPTTVAGGLFCNKTSPIHYITHGLKKLIQTKCVYADQITLVAHSLGGLAARQYLIDEIKAERNTVIKKLIFLATPNNREDIARLKWLIPWRQPLLRKICRSPEFMTMLNDDWNQFRMQERFETLFVAAGQDEVVDETEAKRLWDRGRFEIALDETHLSISSAADRNSTIFETMRLFIHERTDVEQSLTRKELSHKEVELAAILDWIVRETATLLNRNWSTCQMWEILRKCRELREETLLRFKDVRKLLPPEVETILDEFINTTLKNTIDELEFAIPAKDIESDNNGLPQATDQAQRAMLTQWKNLKKNWINDDGLTAALNKFIANGQQWPLIGFANAIEFMNTLVPDTRFLLKNGPDRYRLLIEVILQSDTVTEPEIYELGFNNKTLLEVMNALIRDKYIEVDEDGYALTDAGKHVLPGMLAA